MTTLSCRWPILGFDKNDMLSKSFFWGTANGSPKLFSWYSVIRICSNIFFLAKFLKGRILHVCFLVITHVFTKRGHSAEHIYKRSTILCMESFFFSVNSLPLFKLLPRNFKNLILIFLFKGRQTYSAF